MQKYSKLTASLMAVWFLLCAGLICSDLAQFNHGKTHESGSVENSIAAVDMVAHDTHLEHSCCSDDDGEHEMANALSLSSWLIEYLFVPVILTFFSLLQELKHTSTSSFYTSGESPPNTNYPPVFLTTQRLLN